MKIFCEKCHEDITIDCNRDIENYKVGKTVCPHCHYEQKRYISESDLLLYFAINEVLYTIMTYLSVLIFDRFGVGYISIILLIIMLAGFYFISKYISTSIYLKAFNKEDIKNKVFDEDQKAIQRNMSWQFMMFFAIAITYITVNEAKLFFGLAMPVAAALSFLKYYLQLKNEKNQ